MPNGGGSQLLELTLLSARDLVPVSKSMKAFAVVWIEPDRKLQTGLDGNGQKNPAWNEKFVFRLGRGEASSSAVNIEIYATKTQRNDAAVPLGSVSVLVASLFPPDNPSQTPSDRKRIDHRRSGMRFLTLQVRRPSGRPQGVVDIGVALLDGTRRSMPLSSSELSASVTIPDSDLPGEDRRRTSDAYYHHHHHHHHFKSKLRRSKSERSISEVYLLKPAATESDSVVSESAANGGKGRASVSSDLGPSPSVVAAAIAMGVYPTVVAATGNNNKKKRLAAAAEETEESSILEDWVEEDDSVEGLKTKIERWRSEIHPLYQNNMIQRSTYKKNGSGDLAAVAATPSKRGHRRAKSGLFSCFGTAYGCEFSITCGGGKHGRKNRSNDDDDDEGPISLSELHYGDQYV